MKVGFKNRNNINVRKQGPKFMALSANPAMRKLNANIDKNARM